MNNYIDLVIVEVDDVKILCQAPEFSHLKKGDKVIVGGHMVDVIASDCFSLDASNETLNLVMNAFDMECIDDIPKLASKVLISDFIYKERG